VEFRCGRKEHHHAVAARVVVGIVDRELHSANHVIEHLNDPLLSLSLGRSGARLYPTTSME
jgi:hypothetical protein